LAIAAFSVLFSLLETQYGGNGTTDFALPNLHGAGPLGPDQGTWCICTEGQFPMRN
jgi:microcystin-dependent protein